MCTAVNLFWWETANGQKKKYVAGSREANKIIFRKRLDGIEIYCNLMCTTAFNECLATF